MVKTMQEDRNVQFFYASGVYDNNNKTSPYTWMQVAEMSRSMDNSQEQGRIEKKYLLKYKMFICNYLQAHFGNEAEAVQKQILQTEEEEILSELIYRLFQIRTLEEVNTILKSGK